MEINYNILASGSKGNAVILKEIILIDVGVPFKTIKNYYKNLKLVLLTHQHFDHFNKTTIAKLARERPTLRFSTGSWLVQELLDCGVNVRNIDIVEPNKTYNYGIVKIKPIELYHNVQNLGYKILFKDYKVIYATDTNKIITQAKGYDLYLIEANYEENTLQQRINDKILNAEFVYEYSLPERHLSKEKCIEFLLENMGENSKYIFMHKNLTYKDD